MSKKTKVGEVCIKCYYCGSDSIIIINNKSKINSILNSSCSACHTYLAMQVGAFNNRKDK